MNELERKFLLAVERGDINTLKTLLQQQRYLNIDCCDPLARNALVIAIDNENLEIVKLLIEAKITIGDALLYAIDENFVEAVELLLDHEVEQARLTGQAPSWEQERENSFFSADMTPLILAAHRNHFEIIKLLLDRRVSPIPDPHDPQCDCRFCCKARADDCLKHSRSRINTYRALAAPCLMALSCVDPLLRAFELSAKLEGLAKLEPEYKQDYLRLRAQCQTFATKLLDHTRTSKELEILLNYSDEYLEEEEELGGDEFRRRLTYSGNAAGICLRPLQATGGSVRYPQLERQSCESHCSEYAETSLSSTADDTTGRYMSPTWLIRRPSRRLGDAKSSMVSLDSVTGRPESYGSSMRLARLRLAIQCKQKSFCAHPNIQELLATMWYENLPGFRRKSFLAQTVQILCIGIMFPIYSVAYLIAPHSQLGRYIKKPFIKFICHSASYITFLIVLILASQRVEAFYNWSSVFSLFSSSAEHQFNFGDLSINPNGSWNLLAPQSVASTGTNSSPAAASQFVADASLFKQLQASSPPLPTHNAFDDVDLNTLNALYKQLGAPSNARGLNSLSKMFEELPASSRKRGTLPSPIEFVISIWVCSLIWAEVKQIRLLGLNYYKDDMWNILDSVASGFYVGAIVFRFVSYLQCSGKSVDGSSEVAREHWHAYDPTLLSEGLFAAATIFSALKLVYIFSVNPYLGPLQISLGRMTIDILRFSWIYMLVLFAFACGMNQLLWYYADLQRHQCLNVTNYNLAQYYSSQHEQLRQLATADSLPVGTPPAVVANKTNSSFNVTTESSAKTTTVSSVQNTTASRSNQVLDAFSAVSLEDENDLSKPPITIDDSCKSWRHFSNVFESLQTLFWANFGLVDLENFDLTGIRQYTRFWALLMFGCYCFINVIVVLNLLIAMMNHSYVKISKRSDIEWKFARTRLWMSYFDTGSTVPAPFNIIPSIKSMTNLIFGLCNLLRVAYERVCCCCTRRAPSAQKINTAKVSTTAALPAAEQSGEQPKRPTLCQAAASAKLRERARQNIHLTTTYRNVIRLLVRRYLVTEQRLLEKKRELTEAKLNRWAKLNAFD